MNGSESKTLKCIDGYKIKAGRKRTQVTTYQDMPLHRIHPAKKKKKKTGTSDTSGTSGTPSSYADYNYHNRMNKRRNTIQEIFHNNFDIPHVVMLSLTYDTTKLSSSICSNLEQSHREFKKFIQRVCSHYDNFKYLATFNRQRNGNWHYHVMCNFPSDISNTIIKNLWKNGLTHITRIRSKADLETAIKYLITNMENASGELKKKRGYLCSKNCERDHTLTSWHEDTQDEFQEAFERVENTSRTILYETHNHLGIKGSTINEDTGEIAEYHIPDRELNSTLEKAGYESWDTTYTHLSSSADFSDKFAPLLPATEKPKRRKNK